MHLPDCWHICIYERFSHFQSELELLLLSKLCWLWFEEETWMSWAPLIQWWDSVVAHTASVLQLWGSLFMVYLVYIVSMAILRLDMAYRAVSTKSWALFRCHIWTRNTRKSQACFIERDFLPKEGENSPKRQGRKSVPIKHIGRSLKQSYHRVDHSCKHGNTRIRPDLSKIHADLWYRHTRFKLDGSLICAICNVVLCRPPGNLSASQTSQTCLCCTGSLAWKLPYYKPCSSCFGQNMW